MYKCPNNLGFFIYLCGRNYNRFLNMMNYREINWEVMIDTKIRYESDEELITSRIKKILDVAAKERVEVLILGAWGCGAFRNPREVVAKKQLRNTLTIWLRHS